MSSTIDLSPGLKGELFGLSKQTDQPKFSIISAPWDVTVSYGGGTAQGPDAILTESCQLDLEHPHFGDISELGFQWLPGPVEMKEQNNTLRTKALKIIDFLESGGLPDTAFKNQLNHINSGCRNVLDELRAIITSQLKEQKWVGVVGGDHSISLAPIEALADFYQSFGILQFDAHMDLRHSYEGFTYSHASVMYNIIQNKAVEKLVQVGIRDYSKAEQELSEYSPKIQTFYDIRLQDQLFQGKNWHDICDDIIQPLPNLVYISFDIDGLAPELCPNTGTPVPGGINFSQMDYLLNRLAQSGRKIIGFDLVEVSLGRDNWDANVGARVLYHLCGYQALSQRP